MTRREKHTKPFTVASHLSHVAINATCAAEEKAYAWYMTKTASETVSIPDPITTAEAASQLKVSEQYVRGLLRSKALKGRQLGKQWIVSEAAVGDYKKSNARSGPPDRRRRTGRLPKVKALSFFSGAMGLDLGLERAGIHVLLACELDKACRQTISINRPDIGLIGDISAYTASDIRNAAGLAESDEIDVVVGGPPCQAFSTAGARRGFNDDRGNVFLQFVDLVLQLKPRFAVIENVRGLLSAPLNHRPHAERDADWKPGAEEMPGGALVHVLDKLRAGGYGVSFNLYNAANFGVPQSRERVILLCSRDGEELPYLNPTHSEEGQFGLPRWRTLRDALEGIDPKGGDAAAFPENRLRFYRMLGPGEYWKHLPEELHREALGGSYNAGGGKTGFLRRLSWDKPSCTLVTSPAMPATDICHPNEDRPLSVQEYKRIQQFPDDWIVAGTLADQYRQIGNAVPVGLGEAVGRAIVAHLKGRRVVPPAGFQFSRYRDTDHSSWEAKTRALLTSSVTKNSQRARKPKDKLQLQLV